MSPTDIHVVHDDSTQESESAPKTLSYGGGLTLNIIPGSTPDGHSVRVLHGKRTILELTGAVGRRVAALLCVDEGSFRLVDGEMIAYTETIGTSQSRCADMMGVCRRLLERATEDDGADITDDILRGDFLAIRADMMSAVCDWLASDETALRSMGAEDGA